MSLKLHFSFLTEFKPGKKSVIIFVSCSSIFYRFTNNIKTQAQKHYCLNFPTWLDIIRNIKKSPLAYIYIHIYILVIKHINISHSAILLSAVNNVAVINNSNNQQYCSNNSRNIQLQQQQFIKLQVTANLWEIKWPINSIIANTMV